MNVHREHPVFFFAKNENKIIQIFKYKAVNLCWSILSYPTIGPKKGHWQINPNKNVIRIPQHYRTALNVKFNVFVQPRNAYLINTFLCRKIIEKSWI